MKKICRVIIGNYILNVTYEEYTKLKNLKEIAYHSDQIQEYVDYCNLILKSYGNERKIVLANFPLYD